MTAMLDAAAANGSDDGARLTNQATFAIDSILEGVSNAAATAELANITVNGGVKFGRNS